MFGISFLIYILVVVMPMLFWLWFFRYQDRAEPEPKKLIIKVLLSGIFVVILASVAESFIENTFFPEISMKMSKLGGDSLDAFLSSPEAMFGFLAIYFLAGPIEEFMKFFILKWIIYNKKEFNQVADGVIYGVTIALGFSFIENSVYFINTLSEVDYFVDFLAIVMLRGVITTMLHVVATAIMGLYLGRAKFSQGNREVTIFKGVFIASMVHGAFNITIFLPFGMIANLLLVILCLLYIVKELKTPRSRMIWRLVVPAKGISKV